MAWKGVMGSQYGGCGGRHHPLAAGARLHVMPFAVPNFAANPTGGNQGVYTVEANQVDTLLARWAQGSPDLLRYVGLTPQSRQFGAILTASLEGPWPAKYRSTDR